MGERKEYDSDFKVNAVKLSYERKNLTGLSRDLGITPYLIYRWRKEYSQYGEGSFPGNGVPKLTPEEKEIAELREKLRKIEVENEILKKALHIISKSDR
ncbi:transposase [uncultured Bacteroides sp.]|uniref:transposase n=1 Tax=uncultured Bacteroides sp. TaxID=162156 RepID=UPI0029F59A33|nr:transposase [uncultured Bacteroides sp.]